MFCDAPGYVIISFVLMEFYINFLHKRVFFITRQTRYPMSIFDLIYLMGKFLLYVIVRGCLIISLLNGVNLWSNSHFIPNIIKWGFSVEVTFLLDKCWLHMLPDISILRHPFDEITKCRKH